MTTLTAAETARLAELGDLFIPRSDTMPSATDAAAHTDYLERVFEVRPDLIDAVRAALLYVPAVLPPPFEQLAPEQFAPIRPIADAISAAYFINPEVAKRVGYRKRSVIPIRFDEDLDSLVAPVTARGEIYRPTPFVRSAHRGI